MLSNKRYSLLLAALIIMFALSGCSASKSSSAADGTSIKSSSTAQSATGMVTNSDNKATTAASPATANTAQKENSTSSKIVKTATFEMETLKFDAAINAIQNKCTELGGYAETSNVSGNSLNAKGELQERFANLKLRIPKDKYSIFMNSFGSFGNITNKQESGENITEQYFDTDAHLSSLKVQEERLLELLKKSGDLTSILSIEKELQNVRYQIETLTTSLKKMDNLVDYSTFILNIHEVQKVTPATVNPVSLSGKIAKSFNDSVNLLVEILKGVVIVIVYVLPFAVILGLLFLLWFFSKKLYIKHHKKNNDK